MGDGGGGPTFLYFFCEGVVSGAPYNPSGSFWSMYFSDNRPPSTVPYLMRESDTRIGYENRKRESDTSIRNKYRISVLDVGIGYEYGGRERCRGEEVVGGGDDATMAT